MARSRPGRGVSRFLKPVLSPQIPVHVYVGFIVFGSSAHRNENIIEDLLGCIVRRQIMVPAAKKRREGARTPFDVE
jgi:hypothetical protein